MQCISRNVGLGLVLVGWGCASSLSQIESKPVEVVTDDQRVVDQTLNDVTIELTWELDNPNVTGAGVESVAWHAQIGDRELTGKTSEPKVASPHGRVQGHLQITLPFAEADIVDESAHGDTLPFAVTAEFDVDAPSGRETFEAEWTGDISKPRKVRASAEGRAARDGRSTQLAFAVSIHNPNDFDVIIDGMSYTISAFDTDLESGQLGSGQRLRPASATEFMISPSIDQEHAGLQRRLGQAKTIPYGIRGAINVGKRILPVKITGVIEFDQE